MYEMALHSYMFEKVTSYKLMKLVALEIEGLWLVVRIDISK